MYTYTMYNNTMHRAYIHVHVHCTFAHNVCVAVTHAHASTCISLSCTHNIMCLIVYVSALSPGFPSAINAYRIAGKFSRIEFGDYSKRAPFDE